MIEQKVIIYLTDEDSNEFGTLTVSAIDYRSDFESNINIAHFITLDNVPIVDEPDNLTITLTKLDYIDEDIIYLKEDELDMNQIFYSLLISSLPLQVTNKDDE